MEIQAAVTATSIELSEDGFRLHLEIEAKAPIIPQNILVKIQGETASLSGEKLRAALDLYRSKRAAGGEGI